MTVQETMVLRPVPGVEVSRLGGEYVLLEPGGRMLRGLNATAGRVWELLDGVRTVGEVASALAGEYAVAAARVMPDVVRLISELFERKLVETVSGGVVR